MITILHGQDTKSSREALLRLIADNDFMTVGELSPEKIAQVLSGTTLFPPAPLIVFENSLRSPIWRDTTIRKLLGSAAATVIFWESDQRPANLTSLIPEAKILTFKPPATAFHFLDNLRPGNPKVNLTLFRQAASDASPEIIFSLLVKRTLDLLSPPTKAASWQISKLNYQAKSFSRAKLEQMAKDLLKIDRDQKTSSFPGDLSYQLEFFLLKL